MHMHPYGCPVQVKRHSTCCAWLAPRRGRRRSATHDTPSELAAMIGNGHTSSERRPVHCGCMQRALPPSQEALRGVPVLEQARRAERRASWPEGAT